MAEPFTCAREPMLSCIRELEEPLMLELPVALDPVPVPPLMLEPLVELFMPPLLEPLMLEPLVLPAAVPLMPPVVELPLMPPPVLSDADGTTEPPAVAVSVVFALFLPLHAATAIAAARIAMRFMNPPGKNILSAARRSARHCTRVLVCCRGNKRTPGARMREGHNHVVAPFDLQEEVAYGFFPIFIDESFFIIIESFLVVVVVVDMLIALSCFVVSIMAGAGLMAGAAITAVSAGAESLALHAAIARTATTTARRFIETLLLEGGMWSTLRPSTSVGAMPGASGG